MSKNRAGRLLARVIGGAALACLLYGVAGFFVAPHLIERRLGELVAERLGQTLSIVKLKVNPFALSIEATDLRLAQANGPPMLAARRMYLNLNLLGSGFGRGWVLSEAQTDGLQVQLELQRNGRLNFADLVQRWRQGSQPAKPDDTPVRITVKHLLASDGELTYRKFSGTAAETRILPIRLELANVSTMPDREGRYTVSAQFVDGGTLTWRGDISLPMKSEGDLALEGLKLATIWKFVRDDVRLAEPEGALSLATHYKFSYADGKPELGLTGIRGNASSVRVVREGFAAPILSLKTLEVHNGNFQLDRRVLVLPVVSLSNGSVDIARNADGTWNWTGFARGRDSASNAREATPSPGTDRQARRPWHIDMNAVNVDNVALRYDDRRHPKPRAVETAAMYGNAAVAVIAEGNSLGVLAHDMKLRLIKLALPAGDTPAVELTELRMEGGYVDMSKKALGATQIVVDGGTLLVERARDGAFPIAETFAGNSDSPSTQPTWTYAIGSVRVQGLDVALSDRGFGNQPIMYQFAGLSATIDNIAGAGDKSMTFKAAARIGGGSIGASGSAAPDWSRIDAKIKLNGFALAPLQPFITRYASVDLKSGSASASATLNYRRDGGKTSFGASGLFELAKVRLNETGSDTTVLAWQRLSAGDARFTLGPDRLSITEIVVEAPEAKIDISEQRELNLLQLFRHKPTRGSEKRQTNGDGQESQFPVYIGQIRVRDGTVNYADRSLVLPFTTQVTNFAGTADGIGTNRDRRATLQFEGDIGEFGSAQIDGRIDSFAPKTLTEIHAVFQSVELPDLTPYSATFLGRKIASGRLWLDLKYGIQNSQLTGENDITIRDLRLGESVDTPTALKLPLDLAVALLTDSEGKIRTAVAVKGDLNNPKFAIGPVIREAIGNLIAKIVSAPFRALAGLFRDNRGKDFGSVEFEAGSAKLLASEKEKLQEVAKAMGDRPQLKLVVQAPYAQTDRAAMKQKMASREIAFALGQSPETGEKPEPVVFESLATQRALERLLAKKADSNVVRDLAARHAKRTGAEPKRASLLMRKGGDPDFYKSIYAWLVDAEPLADGSMESLAGSRANAVLEALRSAGADSNRLESGPARASNPEKGKRINAELSLEPVSRNRTTPLPESPTVAQVSR